MFKKGDKVVLLKNIRQEEFASFGNEDYYIEKAATAKYLTIRSIVDEANCIGFYEVNCIGFYEVAQWWKPKWFKKFDTQMEFNFEGEENGR